MKNFIIIAVLAVTMLTIAACSNAGSSSAGHPAKDSSGTAQSAEKSTPKQAPQDAVKGLLESYFQLKNALAEDNSSGAAVAGKAIAAGFTGFDKTSLTTAQKKSFEDIAGDAKEMSEHIGESAGKLPHQREHFEMLSQDMVDLVKLFGAGQTLYVDHCPMYNNNKGANWLSETKAIKNPYLGTKMSTCGSIKEEIK